MAFYGRGSFSADLPATDLCQVAEKNLLQPRKNPHQEFFLCGNHISCQGGFHRIPPAPPYFQVQEAPGLYAYESGFRMVSSDRLWEV